MRLFNGALGLAVGLSVASLASAATITSTNFSVGYGFDNTDSWTTNETTGSNTLLSGDYDITITVAGTKNSDTGPTFGGRTLTTGTLNRGGASGTFLVTAVGTYTGSAPGAAVDPDYQVQVNITSIRIFGAPFDTGVTRQLNFNETTGGHASSQSPQNITHSGSVANSASYTQIDWNPGEFFSAVDTTSQTRTFTLSESVLGDLNLDGFEIEGNIVVSYNQVPEPASMGLIALAGLLAPRWRGRRGA